MGLDKSEMSDEERQQRLHELVQRCMRQYMDSGVLDQEQVLAEHSGLMPELAERLDAMRLIVDAGRVAGQPADETQDVGRVAANDCPLPREAIPGYELIRLAHRGGQGAVYQAMQKKTNRKVAIKVMREGPFAGPKDKMRFEREIRILGALKHPNIATIYESGVTPHGHYYAMDYIAGEPLDTYAATHKPSLRDMLQLFQRICEAVNAAHLKGVVHRDLKPGNILVDECGNPCIVDFGLARVSAWDSSQVMTVSGQFIGSLPWSAPEQAEGRPDHIDTRTDVYALGVVLYQLLTQRFPYPVNVGHREVMDHIVHAEPPRPSTVSGGVDKEVDMVVLKALAKERERRYQTAGELARDIGRYLSGEPIEARRDSAWYVARKSLRRHRGRLLVTAVFLAAVSAAVLLGRQSSTRSAAVPNSDAEISLRLLRAERDKEIRRNIQRGVPAELFEPPPTLADVDFDATLRRVFTQPPTQWCPALPGLSKQELQCAELLYDTLFLRSPGGYLSPNPAVVEGTPEWDAHDTTYRLELRADAAWHDGRPLTVEDIAFSWSVYSAVHGAPAVIEQVSAAAGEVVAVFGENVPEPERWLNFDIIPQHVYGSIDLNADEASLREQLRARSHDAAVIGNGPYTLTQRSDKELLFERWEAYVGEKPYFAAISVVLHNDPDARLKAFLEGRIDETELREAHFAAYRDLTDRVFSQAGYAVAFSRNQYNVVLWNIRRRPELFGDRRVRQALAQAFDLPAAMTAAGLDPQDRVAGIFPVLSPAYEVVRRPWRYAPEEAGALLAASGWTMAEGLLVKRRGPGDVVPFAFTMIVPATSVNSVSIAESMAADLEHRGIRVQVQCTDVDTWKQARVQGSFDATMAGVGLSVHPDGDRRLWHSQDGQKDLSSPVAFGYHNARVDDLFDAALAAPDLQRRRALYLQLQEVVYEDQPVMFLYHRPALWALSRRLRGVTFGIRGPFRFHPGVRAWWTPKPES